MTAIHMHLLTSTLSYKENISFCYGNSGSMSTDTIFNAYGEGLHLDKHQFEETLLKTAVLQHDQFITIMRNSKVTELFLVKDIDQEFTHWNITVSSDGKFISFCTTPSTS